VKNENIKKNNFNYGTNNLYTMPLGVYKYDCQCNMHAELPLFRLEHTKLWWRKHTCHFDMYFARIGVCMKILIWWVLGLYMLHGVVLLYAWTGSMPPVGGWHRENLCEADFHRPRTFAKLNIVSWDGENWRGIHYFSYIHQQTRLLIDS